MRPPQREVNNELYDTLGSRWYEADDDPVALLRAESRLRNPWVVKQIQYNFDHACAVLDIGCGAGFLANHLAASGHHVTGLDASEDALRIASHHDCTASVKYEHGNALALPYADQSFDVVSAMDFLEHVSEPERVIREVTRVLKPSGLFFFHTFNRNWMAWLIVIKGVEWFVKNTPKDMHVLHLFLKPEEVRNMCTKHGLTVKVLHGSRPKLDRAFMRMLFHGSVPRDFGFTFSRSTHLAYTGMARKESLSRGVDAAKTSDADHQAATL